MEYDAKGKASTEFLVPNKQQTADRIGVIGGFLFI